jgi:Arc/MetJ-type ribon-helix-helix transcriptional regulator
MPKKFGTKLSNHITIRLSDANLQYIKDQVERGRFTTRNAYFKDLLDKHRTGKDSAAAELQDSIVSTLLQFRKDLRGDLRAVRQTGDANAAFLHALAKMLLVTLPEATPDLRKLLQATAPQRYKKLLVLASKEFLNKNEDENAEDANSETNSPEEV